MKSFNMEVSKKENGAYVKQGEVAVFYGELTDFGISIAPSKYDDEGFPVYDDPKVQYVFDGVLAATKAQARNKLVSGSAVLKDGAKIAETVDELLESGGGNKGEALANVRDMLASFKTFLATTGKSQKVQEAILSLASNKKSLLVITQEKKDKFAVYLSDFAESLDDAQAGKFSRPLLALSEACAAGDALDDM